MFKTLKTILLEKQFRMRLIWTFLILIVYEIGQNVLIPGIDKQKLTNLINSQYAFNLASSLTGGNLHRFSLFALGLGPYMSALIIWGAFSSIKSFQLERLSKNKSHLLKILITIIVAFIQGFVIAKEVSSVSSSSIFNSTNFSASFIIAIILTIGAVYLSWLSDRNNELGIGGPGVLIIAGLVSNLFDGIKNFFEEYLIDFFTFHSIIFVFVVIVGAYFLLMIMVFMYQAEYRIPVEHIMINSELSADSYISIKLVPAGAMPFMFGVSFFAFVRYLILFFSSYFSLRNSLFSSLLKNISLSHINGIVLYLIVLSILSFAFAFLNINPGDISENMQKNGDYIINIRPGKQTESYINLTLMRMSTIGTFYIDFISVVPLIIGLRDPVFTNYALYLGVLVTLVSMVLTIIDQVRALTEKYNYDVLLPFFDKRRF
ncbi:accessory Sec system protein translocase subunit SecY2 [Oenococcus sp. UCMA 17063]|nr:accessory Sec system protein translocase subunit SecY2 [Oenococcus sp. UCMA 17063]